MTLQLTREETRERAEGLVGERVLLREATAVGTGRVLEGFNLRHYGSNVARVSYIGNSNGYSVAAVHFAGGGSATVTMDRIERVLTDVEAAALVAVETYQDEYPNISATVATAQAANYYGVEFGDVTRQIRRDSVEQFRRMFV